MIFRDTGLQELSPRRNTPVVAMVDAGSLGLASSRAVRVIFTLSLLLVSLAVAAVDPAEKFATVLAPLNQGPVSLSPDGRHLACAMGDGDKTILALVTVDGLKTQFTLPVGKAGTRSTDKAERKQPVRVSFLRWIDNNRVVASTSLNYIIVVNLAEKKARHLIDFNDEKGILEPGYGLRVTGTMNSGRVSGAIVALPVEEPDALYVSARYGGYTLMSDNFASDSWFHVYKINLTTGTGEKVFDDRDSRRFVFDSRGQVRGWIDDSLGNPSLRYRQGNLPSAKWPAFETLHPEASVVPSPKSVEAHFGPRSFPLAFDLDPNVVYFSSNIGRDTLGVYSLDLRTGKRGSIAFESGTEDLGSVIWGPMPGNLAVDRVTRQTVGIRISGVRPKTLWLDPELKELQAKIESQAPAHVVSILEWSDAREAVLALLFSRSHRGTYYLYHKATGKLTRVMSLVSDSPTVMRTTTRPWAVKRPDGTTLSGLLTLPEKPAVTPAPVVVFLQKEHWRSLAHYFQAEVMALAQMGFAVLEVGHRGASGMGLAHWHAGRGRTDEVVAEDVLAALDALPKNSIINPSKVAIMGEGFGGYLTLRLLQLQPERFACGVALEPITNLNQWLAKPEYETRPGAFALETRKWYFGTDRAKLAAQSPSTRPETLVKPLFLGAIDYSYRRSASNVPEFRRQLTKAGRPPTYAESASAEFNFGRENAPLFVEIETFLRKHLVEQPATTNPEASR